jgi:pimeloyl-ACP methyl ester carboxylesterase
MSSQISVFRSTEGEARYRAAYAAALRLWPVPYEELCIPTRLGETHIVACGSKNAPALLLLHPAGCGSTIWCRNAGALSKHFRIYAIDTMGEVNLSRPARPIRGGEDFFDWMADLLDALKIRTTYLVGNSFGGYVALNTARALPERVKKVVLISPAATFDPMRPLYRHFTPAYILRYLTGSTRPLLRAYDWTWHGFPRDDCIAQLRVVTAIDGVMRHGAPAVFPDDELRKIRTPVLLLIGDHEVIYEDTQRVVERATRLLTNLKVDRIPNANHNAEYTNPEAVNKKILEFFKDGSEASARGRPQGALKKRAASPGRRNAQTKRKHR